MRKSNRLQWSLPETPAIKRFHSHKLGSTTDSQSASTGLRSLITSVKISWDQSFPFFFRLFLAMSNSIVARVIFSRGDKTLRVAWNHYHDHPKYPLVRHKELINKKEIGAQTRLRHWFSLSLGRWCCFSVLVACVSKWKERRESWLNFACWGDAVGWQSPLIFDICIWGTVWADIGFFSFQENILHLLQ